jgi:hypothetical protein
MSWLSQLWKKNKESVEALLKHEIVEAAEAVNLEDNADRLVAELVEKLSEIGIVLPAAVLEPLHEILVREFEEAREEFVGVIQKAQL